MNAKNALCIVALSLFPLAGCKTAGQPATTATAINAEPRLETGKPLKRALTPVVVRGWVEARTGETAWRRLETGKAVTGLSALRAVGRGAMLTISGEAAGGEAGRLWLRGAAQVRLGQDDSGTLRVHVERGDVRVSLYDAGLRAVLLQPGRAARTISGQDLLARGAEHVMPTALSPRAADWTLAMLATGEPASAGFGSLSARTRKAVASLELRRVQVHVFTSGDMAETRVEHVFHNESDERLEGTFRFPLPEQSALVGLAMEINGKLMEGELVGRQKARQTYESIVDAMQDPALLEWEQGNTFKLRVFPIEPRSEKRIVLRYVAPLSRSAGGLAYVYDTAAADMQQRIPRFSVTLNGETLIDERGFAPGRVVTARVDDPGAGTALRELRKDGVYTALRLRPDWSKTGAGAVARAPRDLLVVVDTSRSALESRKLCLETLRALLGDLRGEDRFLVLAVDLTVRGHAPGFVAADAHAARRALAFVEGIEPDGASDLGLALRAVGEQLARRDAAKRRLAQVVYIGDGTATWGETAEERLTRIAAESLDEAPLHAVILGKGASAGLLRRLAARQGGRAIKPRTPREVQRLALQLAGGAAVPRLRHVRIRAGEHDQVFPRQAPTLFFGEELLVLMRTPANARPARTLVLEGIAGGRRFVQTFAATKVAPARYVAHRWARQQLARLEADGAPKEEVVKHSLRYGVMSRHTAFLVLDSEEAYKRFKIARKNRPEADSKPTVTGGDLENLGQARAGLSPDHFQPGDPEVRVPAPADARSVVVVFPFGETKVARYEADIKAWTVRFLVAQDTPDGTYQITVRVTHRDGRVEVLRLSYVVDTKAPTVKVSIRKRGRGYFVCASQIVTRHELVQEAHRDRIAGKAATIADGAGLKRYAAVVKDATRVEVRLPGGAVKRLWPYAMGKFGATWRPAARLKDKVTLTVVAVDKANNRSVFDVVFDPRTGKVSRGAAR